MIFAFLGKDSVDYWLKLTLAILCPMIGLGVIASGVLFCLLARRSRRKRSTTSKRNKLLIDLDIGPSILHFTSPSSALVTTYHPHELRATAAGDSTLKVNMDYLRQNHSLYQCRNAFLHTV